MADAAWRRNLLVCLCLAVAIIVVYAPACHFGFVNYDDDVYVTANAHVQSGLTLRGLGWAFTTHHAANWHPLTWLSHMLDWQLWGGRAGMHHLVNVLLHVANALLLFGVLSRMTASAWRSALVAGLFALHPLHVESVAWISERKDVLSACFWLLTTWAYVRYAEGRNPKAKGRRPSSLFRLPSPASICYPCLLRAGADGQTDGGHTALRVAAAGLLAIGPDALGEICRQ